MCADDGEPSLIFSKSVGWRRDDGGGTKRGGSSAGPLDLLALIPSSTDVGRL